MAESLEEQLMTIIDFCNEMATIIRGDWSDPRTECRAIWDAHDIAHVLLGGDKTRDWGDIRARLGYDPRYPSDAWPDVKRRMEAVVRGATGEESTDE